MRSKLAALLAAAIGLAAAQSAVAADLPVKAPVYKAPPMAAYSWTGFYFGINGGGGWGSNSADYVANDPLAALLFNAVNTGAPPSASFNTSGAIAGVQLGYNWQVGQNWLVGAEADFDWANIKGSATTGGSIQAVVPFTNAVDERVDWFGTLRARLGYLPTPNLLAFVTGGLAYGQVKHTGTYTTTGLVAGNTGVFSFSCTAGNACFTGSSTDVTVGWTIGGGLEYAFWQRWTLRGEYLFVSLPAKSLTETALTVAAGTSASSFNANFNRTEFSVARAALSYRF